jgi:hypothetical protein
VAIDLKEILNRFRHRRVVRYWKELAGDVDQLDLASLRAVRSKARSLRQTLDRVLHVADSRLSRPFIGANTLKRPLNSDWVFRPETWYVANECCGMSAVKTKTKFGDEVSVFHDCKTSEISLRQIRNRREKDLSAFGLQLDVLGFDGGFLSLVIHLPNSAAEGLKRNHLVGLSLKAELERPLEIFARLNIQYGPNSEQITHKLDVSTEQVDVEFDLAYTNLNESRAERMWIDFLIDDPKMSQIFIRDLTLNRRPRAAI